MCGFGGEEEEMKFRIENTCTKSQINSLTIPKQPLWPQDGRRAQQAPAQSLSIAACERAAAELHQENTESTISEHPPLPPQPLLVSTLRFAFHRAVLIAACSRPAVKRGLCADLERCQLPERQRIPGAGDVFPEACS